MMRAIRMISAPLSACLAIAGCGSSGSSSVLGPNTENFAPNIPLNVAQTANAVTRRDPNVGDISIEAVPVQIAFRDDGTIALRFEGGNETILTNTGTGQYEGITPGTNEEITLLASNQLPVGTHVSAVSVSVDDLSVTGGLDIATALLGNPSNNLPDANGVSYTGDAHVQLSASGVGGTLNLDGTVILNANFANGNVTGSLTYARNGDKTVGLVAPATLTGNSFSSTQVVEVEPNFSLSNSSFDGTFYGDGAPEVAGTIVFDYVDDDAGETGTVGATYLATQ